MANNISLEDVSNSIKTVNHPAINMNLVDLGMVRDIELKDNKVSLTLVLPFAGIPILDSLKQMLKGSVRDLDVELEINMGQMTQEEVQTFLAKEQEAWKGL
ncbi:MAG: iron-sulfur cluster assembly protein [Thermodesulfobacteriota bacterium]|nr:iron-sulfur cluster assembly protein [Thermodesulfobacteriota bacterium]